MAFFAFALAATKEAWAQTQVQGLGLLRLCLWAGMKMLGPILSGWAHRLFPLWPGHHLLFTFVSLGSPMENHVESLRNYVENHFSTPEPYRI